jgi:hypothetical protein
MLSELLPWAMQFQEKRWGGRGVRPVSAIQAQVWLWPPGASHTPVIAAHGNKRTPLRPDDGVAHSLILLFHTLFIVRDR